MAGSKKQCGSGLAQVHERFEEVETPRSNISVRCNEIHEETSSTDHGPLMDAMPAIIAAFEQYFDIHGKVEDFLAIMKHESLNGKDFDNLKEGLMTVELQILDKLLVLLSNFLENSWSGKEKIFNDSGVSLLSLICNLTIEFRGKDRRACFKTVGDLQAWYVGELLSRRDRGERCSEACDKLLRKIESVH